MAIEPATTTETRRFRLRNGEVAAELSGSPSARLVIGIPGLSANLRSYDVIFDALDPARHRRLAFDPRGRGTSEKTPPGTYGWPAHCRDIAEMADQLDAPALDLIGWSMGTWIALQFCQLYPDRVRRLVLVDGGGIPDDAAREPIYRGVERLDTVYPSFDAFAQFAEATGVFTPWPAWEALFRYELEDVDGGVRARTIAAASWEDEQYRLDHDPYALWPAVTMPSLVVRASREILPGCGSILTRPDVDRFLREVPGSHAVEVDTGHYQVGMHPEAARAIAAFLDEE